MWERVDGASNLLSRKPYIKTYLQLSAFEAGYNGQKCIHARILDDGEWIPFGLRGGTVLCLYRI